MGWRVCEEKERGKKGGKRRRKELTGALGRAVGFESSKPTPTAVLLFTRLYAKVSTSLPIRNLMFKYYPVRTFSSIPPHLLCIIAHRSQI